MLWRRGVRALAFPYRRTVVSLVRLLYLVGLVAIFGWVWQSAYGETIYWGAGNYVVLLSYSVMLLVFMNLYGALRVGSFRITNLLLSSFFALMFTSFFIYLELSLIARKMLELWPMVVIFGAQFLLAMLGCYLMNTVYYALNNARQVVAVTGGEPDDTAVIEKMKQIDRRFQVVKVIDAATPLEEITQGIEPYDSVLLGAMEANTRTAIFEYCYRHGKRINILPTPMDIAMSVATQTQLFDTPILLCKNRELTPEQRFVKRGIDFLFAVLGIAVMGLPMLIIALLIKLDDGGPVFYRQARLTLGGKPFYIFKFRSMRVDADKDLPEEEMRAVENDERITRIGRGLRPYRLDEFPQLFNILTGDMSIVGPRPERVEHYSLYTQQLPDFALRLRAKAGLTGYAQIYGKYNTTPRDKLNMDLFYIENFSVLQDMRLIFITLKVLFIRESSAGFETAPPPQSKPEVAEPVATERQHVG